MKTLTLLFALALGAMAQGVINGNKTIVGRWDASGAASTSPVKAGPLSAIPGTCTAGDFYFATDGVPSRKLYSCTTTNTWVPIGYRNGTSDPATCTVSELFVNTTGTPTLKLCTVANTWSAVGSSGSSTPGVPYTNLKRWALWLPTGNSTTPTYLGETSGGTTGTLSAVAASTTDSAAMKATSGTTAASMASFVGYTNWFLTRSPRFQARIRLPSSSDYVTARWFFVMQDASCGAGVMFGSSPSTDTPACKYYGFRGSTTIPDTNWICVHANGSTPETADSGIAINTTGHVFEAYYDYANTQVLYYIDGTRVCSGITFSNIPTGTGGFRPAIGGVNLATDSTSRVINFGAVYTESGW